MTKVVNRTDRLSRIVCNQNKKNYCRVSSNEVKPKAFKPNADGETSIFVTSGLVDDEVWGLGEMHVCSVGEVYGRADFSGDVIEDLEKISVDYNDDPEYHANLVWPEDLEDIQDIAQVLAAKADCVKR